MILVGRPKEDLSESGPASFGVAGSITPFGIGAGRAEEDVTSASENVMIEVLGAVIARPMGA